jgi:hypothetical protein
MPNPARASYDITIGEETFTLRPTFEAIMEFKAKAGMDAFKGIGALSSDPDIEIVVCSIWAGVKGEHIFQNTVDKCPSFSEIGAICLDVGVSKCVFEGYSFLMRCVAADDQKKNTERFLESLKQKAQEISQK